MIIDINMDWLPPELLTDDDLLEQYLHIVPRAYNTFAYLSTIPGTDIKQIMIDKPKGNRSQRVEKACYDQVKGRGC